MAPAFKLNCSDEFLPQGQSNSVINLTLAQQSLLNKGLTFLPSTTITPQTKEQAKLDLEKYHRALKLAEFFKDNKNIPQNKNRPFQPPSHQLNRELQKLLNQDKFLMIHYRLEKEQPNLTHAQRKALKELKNNKTLL